MVLKLLGKVNKDYYDLQDETGNKSTSFNQFDGRIVKGLQFSRIYNPNLSKPSTEYPRLESIFNTIDSELASGRYVMVSLLTPRKNFHIQVIHAKSDDDYLAFSKSGGKTIDYPHSVKARMRGMNVADIMIYSAIK